MSRELSLLVRDGRLDEAESVCHEMGRLARGDRERYLAYLSNLRYVYYARGRAAADEAERRRHLWSILDLIGLQVAAFADDEQLDEKEQESLSSMAAGLVQTYQALNARAPDRWLPLADEFVERTVGPAYVTERERWDAAMERQRPSLQELLKPQEEVGTVVWSEWGMWLDLTSTQEAIIPVGYDMLWVAFLEQVGGERRAGLVVFQLRMMKRGAYERVAEHLDETGTVLGKECRALTVDSVHRIKGNCYKAILFDRKLPDTGKTLLSIFRFEEGRLRDISGDWGELGGYEILDFEILDPDDVGREGHGRLFEVVTWPGAEPTAESIAVYRLEDEGFKYRLTPAGTYDVGAVHERITAPPPPDPRLPRVDLSLEEILGKPIPQAPGHGWTVLFVSLAGACAAAALAWLLLRRRSRAA